MALCQSVILTFCDLKPCQVSLLRPFLSHFCFNRSIFTQCAAREVCNHYRWWLGAQSLVQEPKLVPFLFPVSLGILGGALGVLIQRTTLLLGSVSKLLLPPQGQTLWPYPVPGQGICALLPDLFWLKPSWVLVGVVLSFLWRLQM